MKGCDACIHLALSAGWDQMRTKKQIAKMLQTSQTGTQNILQACLEGKVKVVFFSSAAVRLSTLDTSPAAPREHDTHWQDSEC